MVNMIRAVIATILLGVLSGCAGGFRSEANFQNYVRNLHLNEMTVETAATRLAQDGFKCMPNTKATGHAVPSTYCYKSWRSTPTYQIWIQPSKENPGKSI